MARLAAACDMRRCSQATQDDEIARLAVSCDRRRRSQVPRDGSRWSKLRKDVLDEVTCRLPSLRARLHFAAVCHHWHDAERQHLPYSLPKICLALPDGSFSTFQHGSSSVLMPRDVDLSCAPYRGASRSQLLCDTDDRGAYSLVNPFIPSRKRRLPVPSGIRIHEEGEPAPEGGYFSEEMPVRKLVVCPEGGLVAAIVGHERSARVALCVPEAAWWWTLSAGDPWHWYADMVFFDGKLYALTNNEDLLALEVGYNNESGQPRISHVERVIDGADCSYALQEYTRMRYLVVRPGGQGLLMVCRIMLDYGSTTHQFAVFQADLQSSQWVRVESLGGLEALFVSRLCSRADRHGVPGDHIFFLDDFAGMEGPGLALCDGLANVYDMKDGSISKLLPMRSHVGVPATWLAVPRGC
ncbi:hypothetical protein ACQ4PT_062776 [Festuca glaucescens]